MSWLNNFSQRVETEKMQRVSNLQDVFRVFEDFWWNKITQSDILKFFQEKWVNPETMRDFFEKNLPNNGVAGDRKNFFIEWLITNLSLNEWKTEIISEILKKWPFKNPEDLTLAIAQYIQSKMPYDGISLISQINQALKNSRSFRDSEWLLVSNSNPADYVLSVLNNLWIVVSDDVVKKLSDTEDFDWQARTLLIEWIRSKNIIINETHMKLFSEAFENFKAQGNKLDHPIVLTIEDLIKNNDIKWFSDYIFNQLSDDTSEMSSILTEMLVFAPQISSLWSQTEIHKMLSEVQTWVCRHYSIIMKEVYNAIVKNGEWILFDGKNTEMIYVLNYWKQHAYNVLLTEWKDGGIEKQYLDVTKYIMWNELFSTEKIWESQNKEEVWASRKVEQNFIV